MEISPDTNLGSFAIFPWMIYNHSLQWSHALNLINLQELVGRWPAHMLYFFASLSCIFFHKLHFAFSCLDISKNELLNAVDTLTLNAMLLTFVRFLSIHLAILACIYRLSHTVRCPRIPWFWFSVIGIWKFV